MGVEGIFTQNFALVLTGITTSIIGGFIYYSGNNGILSGGTYTRKDEAVLLLVIKTLLIGGLTPVIHGIYVQLVGLLSPFLVLGLIVIVGTFAINEEVANFRHDTETSAILYGIGVLLILVGLH